MYERRRSDLARRGGGISRYNNIYLIGSCHAGIANTYINKRHFVMEGEVSLVDILR